MLFSVDPVTCTLTAQQTPSSQAWRQKGSLIPVSSSNLLPLVPLEYSHPSGTFVRRSDLHLSTRMAKEKASAALFDQLQKAIESGEGDEIVGKLKVHSFTGHPPDGDVTSPNVTLWLHGASCITEHIT